MRRIAYVDIDVHGDGVFDKIEDDRVASDIHEDGRFLYPGTGAAHETGSGAAEGRKLNLPLAPGAGDGEFLRAWRATSRTAPTAASSPTSCCRRSRRSSAPAAAASSSRSAAASRSSLRDGGDGEALLATPTPRHGPREALGRNQDSLFLERR